MDLDSQCAGWFRPEKLIVNKNTSNLTAHLCYDYMCEDQLNMTRCKDPKFSKENDRHWLMNMKFVI